MKYLLLWLEGPLQSWGSGSRFDFRTTESFPTMSGIAGMLLSSSGDSGAQCELLQKMKNSVFIAVEFRKQTDVSPQLCDYHMVGNGYDESKTWESYQILRKRNREVGGNKQTYRYYLQDKKFAVLLGLEDDLAEKFSASLQAPVFDLYLGRKCCVPTDFIFRGCFVSREEAKAEMLKVAEEKGLTPGRCFVPAASDEMVDDAFSICDVPLEFGENKRYGSRYARIMAFDPSI